MVGEDVERTPSMGRNRNSIGGRSRGGKPTGERPAWDEKIPERRFNAEEASSILTEGWQKTLDELKGPEDERPVVYKRNEKAWTNRGGNAVKTSFLSMLEAAMKSAESAK